MFIFKMFNILKRTFTKSSYCAILYTVPEGTQNTQKEVTP